jgi:uncharacterized protein
MIWLRRICAAFILAALSLAYVPIVAHAQTGEPTGAQSLPFTPLLIETKAGKRLALQVEVARTEEQRNIGLMFRKSMAETKGMLFLFAPPQDTAFWMRNTYIPLDLVFIRADGRIHRIAANAKPFSLEPIPSRGRIAAVLEVNGGYAKRHGLKAGDIIRHADLENWPVAP